MTVHDQQAFYAAVYGQDNPETPARGWIQWKGTDVCMDMVCTCGASGHFDGDFCYYVSCRFCGRQYAVGQNIKLIELSRKQAVHVGEERFLDVFDEPDVEVPS